MPGHISVGWRLKTGYGRDAVGGPLSRLSSHFENLFFHLVFETMRILLCAILPFLAFAEDNTSFLRQLGAEKIDGLIFTMADCPGRCMAYNELSKPPMINLENCRESGTRKYWSVQKSCNGDESFFKIAFEPENDLCIADPKSCSTCIDEKTCNKDIELVDCSSDEAAWFSYGNLHKTSPKSSYLYSARCWLNEGVVFALGTPSLEAKTCPEDHSVGACERLEWNLDRFSKDVLYYEWSYNSISNSCAPTLFHEDLC